MHWTEHGIEAFDVAERCSISRGEQALICDYSELELPKILQYQLDAQTKEISRSWADKIKH
jgi:hypothetical protein